MPSPRPSMEECATAASQTGEAGKAPRPAGSPIHGRVRRESLVPCAQPRPSMPPHEPHDAPRAVSVVGAAPDEEGLEAQAAVDQERVGLLPWRGGVIGGARRRARGGMRKPVFARCEANIE